MGDNNETLETTIKINNKMADAALKETIKSLKNMKAEITGTRSVMQKGEFSKYIVTANTELKKYIVTVDQFGRRLKTVEKEAGKVSQKMKTALDVGKLYVFWNVTKRLRTAFTNVFKSAVDFNETVNKFNVSMGNSSKQATKFQNRIAEAFGTARAEMMDYQSTFKNILGGLGNLSSDTSERISESLVQMGLDYSSLFNVDQKTAMNKFQAALTGSVMPIRRDSGYDVSRNAVSAKASELGIERTYNQLNETEKRLLRILLLTEQLKNTGAFEDMARTIESPSAQIRVLNNQIKELNIWLGNAFMNTIGRILPYVNAFVMVLKELAKMFAILRGGYKQEQGTGLEDVLQEADKGSSNLAGNLGSASKNAKELKKTLMGFDVLNVITTPKTPSGGGAGGGGLPPIDDKILDALEDYNSMLSTTKMRATEIRDRIMEWLGFTKLINPETGEITWKLKDGYTNLEKILDTAKTIGTVLLGWKLSKGVLSLMNLMSGNKMDAFQLQMKTAGIGLMLGGAYATYKGVKTALEDKELTPFVLMQILSGGAMLVSGSMMTFAKGVPLKLGLAMALGIAGLTLGYKGIKKLLKEGLTLESLMDIILGANLTYVAGTLALKKPLAFKPMIKISGIAIAATLGFSILKWWDEYFEEQKTQLYGHEKELNIGEWIHVSLSAVGEGATENIIEPLFGEDWDKPINDFIETTALTLMYFGDDVRNWYNDDVAPWFTKEKWQKFGEDAKKGLDEHLKPLKENFKPVQEWYETQVTPWFTEEKWQQEGEKAKGSLETKFNDFKDNFKPIQEWWDLHIAPWFTWEKWRSAATNSINSLETRYNEWKNNFNPIGDWWNNKVAPWFTWEKWQGLARDAMSAMGNYFSNFNFSIKLPHFSWTTQPTYGWKAQVLEALNLPASLPKLNVSWYANGGLPNMGEMFVAREQGPELVGKIGNSSAVVNNTQIVTAVSQGVASAVSKVMGSQGGSYKFYMDSREMTDVIVERMDRDANIYGY